MWWTNLFCGLLATIVTGEYKRMFWLEYPDCKNADAKPENFMISGPSKTFINKCDGYKKNYKSCFCKITPMIKTVIYDARKCKHYKEYPHQNCKAFIICAENKKYLMVCKFKTVYNPLKMACDHPDHVKCPMKSKPSSKSRKVDNLQKSSEPVCPDTMRELGKFPDVSSGCTSYYECLLGVLEKKDCPEGLIFDSYIHDCNYPAHSICGCSFNKTSIFAALE